MLDAQLFGVPPGGYAGAHHLTSLLLHIANSILLLMILAVTTRYLWKAALVAALFALHPQHVESVAWVAERKDVLSTFFMLWAIIAYVWYARRPSVGRYVSVALAFALGLMSKPMPVTLPVLLLLLDYWPLGRCQVTGYGSQEVPDTRHPTPGARLLLEKLPLLVISAASCVLTVKAQHAVGAVIGLEQTPLAQRLANAAMSGVIYLAKTFWPTKLGVYYPMPTEGWPAAYVIGAVVLLIVITVAAVRLRRIRPYLATGWLWYLITLAPVIGIVQVGSQARADRYTYIPLIGVFVMLVYTLPEKFTRAQARIAAVAAAVIVTALGVVSYVQVGYWRDSATLNGRAIAVTEDNWYSHGSLANVLQDDAERLFKQDRRSQAIRKAESAARHSRTCLSIAPDCSDARITLARSLAAMDDVGGAVRELGRAVLSNPRNAYARDYLGMALRMQGRLDEAIEQFEEASRLNPRFIDAHGNLALAYYDKGEYALAWKHIRACEDVGGHAPKGFLERLAKRMPEPND